MAGNSISVEDLREYVGDLAIGVAQGLHDVKGSAAGAALIHEAVISAGRTLLLFRRACNVKSKDEYYERLPLVSDAAEQAVHWLTLMVEADLVSNDKVAPLLDLAKKTVSALTASKVSRSVRSRRTSRSR